MRRRERGSALLLCAFALLAVGAASTFALHRSVLREWALEGDALQGDRAALAADDALAWFLATWTAPAAGGDVLLAVPDEVYPEGPRRSGTVQVRYLGGRPVGPGEPAQVDAWKVTVTGRLHLGGTWHQVREAYVLTPRGAPGAPPVLAAWRIVR